ncbi:Putative F-box/FBD/LRR-repeat protein At4g03220 [Linum grandiflorum]
METRSAKRKKQQLCFAADDETLRIDRITDLPDAILHHILSYLPIKSIAQTSTLSKRWRIIWYSFPDLDFTTVDAAASVATVLSHRRRYYKTSHDENLRSLRFSASPLTFSALNAIIRLAVRHRVQDLDVEVSTYDYFNFPRALISSETLKTFKLKSTSPGFRLLPSSVMSRGFQSLISLSLSLVKFTEQPCLTDLFTEDSFPSLKNLDLEKCHGLRRLKVSCQGIEEFSLNECYHLRGLEICCGRLETLRVVSCFDAYCGGDRESTWVRIRKGGRIRDVEWEQNAVTGSCEVEELPAVEEAAVGFFVEYYEEISAVKIESVCSFLCGFSRAHTLTLASQCIEILSNRKDSANYSKNPLFRSVQLLELHTGFNKKNVSGLAFIFKSSPILHTLVLKIDTDDKIERRQWNRDLWDVSSSSEQEQYWESQVDSLKAFLNSVKVVKIHGFLEYENEVSLAKFLLKHCKHLREMTLSTPRHCNYRDSLRRQKIRSQMMGFSWASSNANFSFL